jgi:hypothetical protein
MGSRQGPNPGESVRILRSFIRKMEKRRGVIALVVPSLHREYVSLYVGRRKGSGPLHMIVLVSSPCRPKRKKRGPARPSL